MKLKNIEMQIMKVYCSNIAIMTYYRRIYMT